MRAAKMQGHARHWPRRPAVRLIRCSEIRCRLTSADRARLIGLEARAASGPRAPEVAGPVTASALVAKGRAQEPRRSDSGSAAYRSILSGCLLAAEYATLFPRRLSTSPRSGATDVREASAHGADMQEKGSTLAIL